MNVTAIVPGKGHLITADPATPEQLRQLYGARDLSLRPGAVTGRKKRVAMPSSRSARPSDGPSRNLSRNRASSPPGRGSRRPGEHGAAAVEFALVLPILMMLVFGIVDFGYAMNRDTMLNNATREGVRAASVGATAAEVAAVVKADLPGMSDKVTITVSCLKPAGTACASYAADATSGGTAIVKVDYVHTWITPVGSIFSGKTINLSKTSRMRIE